MPFISSDVQAGLGFCGLGVSKISGPAHCMGLSWAWA